MQVKRRVTHILFFIGYRFNGVDSKIVHIFTHVPYDCGSSNKNGLRVAEISRPRLGAPLLEMKILIA